MKSFVINFPGSQPDDNNQLMYSACEDSITVKGRFNTLSNEPDDSGSTHVYIALNSIVNSADGTRLEDYVWGSGLYSLQADILSAENSPLGVPCVSIYLERRDS